MYDDGAHEDGSAGDSTYGEQIPAVPQGTVMRYYVTATDDIGAESSDPVGAPDVTYSYFVDYAPPLLYINEFMASNVAAYEDPEYPGDFDDWLEIYNGESVIVELGGMYLTDDLAIPTKWQVPAGVSILPGEYLILWADEETAQGELHMSFKLSANGEQIGLFDTYAHANMPIDTVAFGAQTADVSMGRFPDGVDNWRLFTTATPGVSNGMPGDLDGDGDVDLSDLAQLLANYGMAGGATYQDGDLDSDGDVDLADLAALLAVYGTSC